MILSHNRQNKNNKFLKMNILSPFDTKTVSNNAFFIY